MFVDGPWLAIAVALYVLAAVLALAVHWLGRAAYRPVFWVLGLALAVHSIAIGARWMRLDHGPYVNMFEVLSSNVWSLHLAVLLACLWIPRIRPALAATLPVLQVLVIWMIAVPATDGLVPVTYDTIWLPIHVWLGKVFLGCVVVAVGLSMVVLIRSWGRRPGAFASMPANRALEELSYRFVLIALLFESLMLAAGAIWARDAWGRYWAWDPLETWAFVTWLAVIFYLHARTTFRPAPALSAIMIVAVFVLAFSTFFGMPFVSTAPHKGAI